MNIIDFVSDLTARQLEMSDHQMTIAPMTPKCNPKWNPALNDFIIYAVSPANNTDQTELKLT